MSFNNDSGVQHAVPASSIQSSIPKSTITKRNTNAKKGVSNNMNMQLSLVPHC